MKTFNVRSLLSAVALVSAVAIGATTADAKERETGRGTGPIIFVTSQGLYYDSIVTASELPRVGPFQQLFPTDVEGVLETDVGPGEDGFAGGRWWLDVNENGMMDADDAYFSCPLLAPGRAEL